MTTRHLIGLLLAAGMLFAACGDDGETSTTSPPAVSTTTPSADDAEPASPGEDVAEDLVDDLTDLQESQGGGSATLTVGDQTWTFDSVLCAFGEEMIGQEGAVFNLSSIQDGMQMYASVDSFGHSVSLNDIEDFENPSVALSSSFSADDFIEIDGKNISAEVGFIDDTSDDPLAETPGTFTATCP